MDIATVVYIVLALFVGGGFAYVMLRRDTSAGTPSSTSLLERIQEAATIATTLVQAAEQMAETGTIERGARFDYVYSRLRDLFPGLSEDTLIFVIEAAVHLVNQGTALLTPPSVDG